MKKSIYLLSLTMAMLFSITSYAQKIFSEGLIKYDVYVNNETKASGIYLISIKSGNIRRELAMNNGYSNVTIFNFKSGNTYSLNLDKENKYALELKPEELKEKNSQFANAQFKPLNKSKKLSGYNCEANDVTYKDGETVTIYFTKELVPQHESFNSMFPGLNGIPLEYEMKTGNSMNMKFIATMIEVKVIDSQLFTIPTDYKIVSKAELDKMK
jgi:hypothetical protein